MKSVEVRLLIELKPPTEDFNYWVATYPEIDLSTQGETLQKALDNAAEALQMWLSSLLEDGILEEVLLDCGLSANRIKEIEEDAHFFIPQYKAWGIPCRA